MDLYNEDYEPHPPNPNFHIEVEHFNQRDSIWSQQEYEDRIQSEAEVMVSLEALREALVIIDHDLDDLEDTIEENHYGLRENSKSIHRNSDYLEVIGEEIAD